MLLLRSIEVDIRADFSSRGQKNADKNRHDFVSIDACIITSPFENIP
jgi:hypothetical protein